MMPVSQTKNDTFLNMMRMRSECELKHYICKAHFKQSSNAPVLHYRPGVESFQLPRECLDGRRQSELCWWTVPDNSSRYCKRSVADDCFCSLWRQFRGVIIYSFGKKCNTKSCNE